MSRLVCRVVAFLHPTTLQINGVGAFMKICTKCNQEKNLTEFSKDKKSQDGYRWYCKSCNTRLAKIYSRTKSGLVTIIYNSQKSSSIRRNHNLPTYTRQELKDWVFSNQAFNRLYKEWEVSGYRKDLKPSVDRLDDSVGYSIDNIQLITWGENNTQANKDTRDGKLTHGNKPQKGVSQYTLDGEFICEHVSIQQAGRETGVLAGNISSACMGIYKQANGFVWKYSNIGVRNDK